MVEAIVAGAIFLTATFAVISAFSYARRTASLTENRLACLHIAREVLETLKAESYFSSAMTVGRHDRLPGHPPARGHYDVEVVESAHAPTKQITVVVNWVEPTGMTQSISLTTVHSQVLHP
ncbi:MAG: hypothetical protein ACOX9C_07515 [Kiritimatiellia bacterium]